MFKTFIKKILPDDFVWFSWEYRPLRDGKSFFEIYGEKDHIVLLGDSDISLAAALYEYLKSYAKVNLSWCGNRTIKCSAFPIPSEHTMRVIEQQYRVYLNYCTLSYSSLWWDWSRWEKEIDFMAMNGINMALCVIGTDYVWYQTLREMGLEKEEALSCISGPAYWPWQLMTNIDGYQPVMNEHVLEKRLELGQKVISYMREWGMIPIMQGFSGHVPKMLKNKFPNAAISKTPPWCGFPSTYQLDPLDPLFEKLGLCFLHNQDKVLSHSHYYACDPFHENEPITDTPEYLNEVGRAVCKLYNNFDSEYVWVMQSWSIRKEIACAVELERLLILDLDGEKYKKNDAFWGYQFVLGTLHNFGGKNSLHGDLCALAENPFATLKKQAPNLVGTGLFMEGINQNPLYYDLAFSMLTCSDKISLDDWLTEYAIRRYGSNDSCLTAALQDLLNSCYGAYPQYGEQGSIVCARPNLLGTRAAPNDETGLLYDNSVLLCAAQKLLQCHTAEKDGFAFDICDVTRQILSNCALGLYHDVVKSYREQNKENFDQNTQRFLQLIDDMDRLTGTRSELRLDSWLLQASSLAENEAMRAYNRKNATMLITIWGPENNSHIYDYAWREWNGLLHGYYYQRWQKFFDMLSLDFYKLPQYPEVCGIPVYDRDAYEGSEFLHQLSDWEREWCDNPFIGSENKDDTVKTASEMITKYAPLVALQSTKFASCR